MYRTHSTDGVLQKLPCCTEYLVGYELMTMTFVLHVLRWL